MSLDALYQLARRVHQSLDFSTVVEYALTGLLQVSGAHSGMIAVVNAQGRLVTWHETSDPPTLKEHQVNRALQNGLLGQVLRHQQFLYISDTNEEYGEQIIPGRSVLIVPFRVEPELQAIVLLTHEHPHAFGLVSEQQMREATSIIATALRNAWLYEQIQSRDQEREMMVNMLVHDIRSPLMATSASIDVINRALEEHPVEAKLQEFLRDSLLSGRRGLQEVLDLTNDLLDVKKLQSGRYMLEYQSIVIEWLYDEIYRLLYSLAVKRKVIIRYQVRPRSLKVCADVRLLRRALINLAINALRFSPSGSTVTMTANAFPEGNLVNLEAYPSEDNERVLFIVEDRGPGVPPTERHRIFQPFAQSAGESRRGTGLGLAFCYEVAIAHAGRIWVEDRPGGGSRFCMEIPSTPSQP